MLLGLSKTLAFTIFLVLVCQAIGQENITTEGTTEPSEVKTDGPSTPDSVTTQITQGRAVPVEATAITTTVEPRNVTQDLSKAQVESVGCEWMTEKERSYAVAVTFFGNGSEIAKWFETQDENFRAGVANALNITISGNDVSYVTPTPQTVPAGLLIYIFPKKSAVLMLEGATYDFNTTDTGGIDLYVAAVKNASATLARESDILNFTLSRDIPMEDCSSLFQTYLKLWIALFAVAFLALLASIILTCYCWKRGKNVQLKKSNSLTLPSTDELANVEYTGIDNPALVITVNDESPPKKKLAPKPPTSTPNLSTFAREQGKEGDGGYDTGIVPYQTEPVPEGIDPSSVDIQDTKL